MKCFRADLGLHETEGWTIYFAVISQYPMKPKKIWSVWEVSEISLCRSATAAPGSSSGSMDGGHVGGMVPVQ